MDINYKVNRLFLFGFTIFILVIGYLTITDLTVDHKLLRIILFCVFIYVVGILYSSHVIITDVSIKNKFYFLPLYPKTRECNFVGIKKITYEFPILEEAGSFVVHPWGEDVNRMVVIPFIIDNKKEIIQKILEKRPDLKLDDWIWDRVLNYKIVRKKFLIVSSVIILICILISIVQHIQR